MSLYLTVSSETSLAYFPDNKPYQFKIKLSSEKTFVGLWKVALLDIVLKDEEMRGNQLYIYANICGESFVNGEHGQLLRKVIPYNRNRWSQEFQVIRYNPVNKTDITDIEFYIKDYHNNTASFLIKPVTLTLHFRAYPFLY
ncbi:MAG: hypothetical protein ABW168_07050 [Sedimenticola sp.]